MAGEVLLHCHHCLVAVARCGCGVAGEQGQLPEDRWRLGGARPQCGTVDVALTREQHLEAVPADDVEKARQLAVGDLGALEEHVRDDKPRVVGQCGVEALCREAARPERPGDVHLDARSITFAVHAAGPVNHHVERNYGARNDLM